jgi:pyruvate decarboxylase
LSIINAIAGAYSGNLPVICLVGAPNSNDYGTNHILHHTLGEPDFSQEYRCFKEVTCAQVNSNHELPQHALFSILGHHDLCNSLFWNPGVTIQIKKLETEA